MTVSISTLATVTVALFVPAAAIARATDKAQSACNAWSTFCAAGLVGVKPSLTLDGIGDALVTAYNAKQPVKGRVNSPSAMNKAGGQGGVVYGWFRMLVRIAAAGDSQLARLATEGLYTVGRGIAATQPQKGKGKPAPTADKVDVNPAPVDASPVLTAAAAATVLSLKDIADRLVAMRKTDTAKAMAANEAQLTRILNEAATMGRMVATYRAELRKAAEAKAAKGKRAPRAAKAA